VDGLTHHPIAAGHIRHRRPGKDLEHRLIPLLHDTSSTNTIWPSVADDQFAAIQEPEPADPSGVVKEPEQLSPRNRNRVPKLSAT
jgi:hypothetical protein